MYQNFSLSNPFSNQLSHAMEQSNSRTEKSQQIRNAKSKECRQKKLSRMRLMHSREFIPFDGISFGKFAPTAESEENPYTILVTIFKIVDNFTWRQYLCHLEILIKKFTNFIESSKGTILEEISNRDQWMQKLAGYNFQERLQSMLHLSNKQFQQHLLVLIHALIAYNKRYCLLDEAILSDHLTYRHPYEKCLRQDVLWLLTRMSVSCEGVNKVAKNYLANSTVSPLLPVLTIIANFIYQQPEDIVYQFISTSDFQNIIERGLLSGQFQAQREAVFVCNNLLFKSQNSFSFIVSQNNLVNQIKNLNNQESTVFIYVIEESRKNTAQNYAK